MPPLMVRCPNTRREFATGLQVDAESFASLPDKLIFANCPLCGRQHTLLKCDARFVEVEVPDSLRLWMLLLELAESEVTEEA
jgi:hypothetical protein